MQCLITLKSRFTLVMVCLIVLLTVSPLIPAPAFVQDKTAHYNCVEPDSRFDEVRSKIAEMVGDGKIASITVAVAQRGKIVWEKSFGWADREKMIKATPNTMYPLGSITKPVTATGIMMLVERGLVKLDESVNTYIAPAQLRAYEGNASDATVKHLLTHTAGLPMHYTFFYEGEPDIKPDMTDSIRRYGILVRPPGEVPRYANFGFGILGYIIEKVSGKSLADFMKNEIFLPLGMTRTSLNIGPGLEEYAATRYESDNTPVPFSDFDHPGASAVYASAHDLVRFGMFHLKDHLPDQKPILEDKTIDEMQNKNKKDKALCWAVLEDRLGYLSVCHSGGMQGAATDLVLIPSEDIAVVVLSNSSDDRIYGVYNKIASAMLPKFKKKLEEAIRKSEEERQPEPEPFKPAPELLGRWEGAVKTYEGEIPVTMEFQEDGDVHVVLESKFEVYDNVSFLETLLNNVSYKDSVLTGQFYGTITTTDAMKHPHNIYVEMRLKGNRLVGSAVAVSTTKRLYWALCSYICLEKEE